MQRLRKKVNSTRRCHHLQGPRDTIEEHVIDGGDDQNLEFFIHFNDEAIRRILQDAIDIHK